MTEIILKGRPITKKNSQIRTKHGPIIQSKRYREYEKDCLWQLKGQNFKEFEDKPVHMKVLYYMPSRRSWPDMVGLMQATADILEKAGVYDNDRQIKSWDGTRIMGIDKHNPRADIIIREWTG